MLLISWSKSFFPQIQQVPGPDFRKVGKSLHRYCLSLHGFKIVVCVLHDIKCIACEICNKFYLSLVAIFHVNLTAGLHD